MRVAPISLNWWYDQQQSTYDPRSVGLTSHNLVDEILVQLYLVNLEKKMMQQIFSDILQKRESKGPNIKYVRGETVF